MPVWPAPPQTPRIKYLASFSTPSDIGIKKSWLKRTIETVFGEEEVQEILLRPYGIFVTQEGIYVTDPGARILHIFNIKAGEYLRIKDTGTEEFLSPIGIAVDSNGDIYLTDSVMRKILVFNSKGAYLRQIGQPELFLRPSGITVDETRIYVIDTHAHHVLIFNKEGKHLLNFGGQGIQKGKFNYPTNIFKSRDGLLYITDSMNFRVQVFDKEGKFISVFGKPGDGSGDFSKPKGIAVDSDGHIYVADAHFDTIQVFDNNGSLLLGFGNTGTNIGQMVLPAGLFIDASDKIYVADSFNHRIQIFQYLKERKNQ